MFDYPSLTVGFRGWVPQVLEYLSIGIKVSCVSQKALPTKVLTGGGF